MRKSRRSFRRWVRILSGLISLEGEEIMYEELKKEIKEISAIADSCPGNLKEKCFEILLNHFLSSGLGADGVGGRSSGTATALKGGGAQKSFSVFLASHKLENSFESVFELEAGKCQIIIKDLKETTTAKKQVRLALLLGIKNLAEKGIPEVPSEELRTLCQEYSCYDSPNFSTHMKKQKNLFLPQAKDWKLTTPGMNEAANVIRGFSAITKA